MFRIQRAGITPGSTTYRRVRLLQASDSSLSPGSNNRLHFLRWREAPWVIAPPPSLRRAGSEALSLQSPGIPGQVESQRVVLSSAARAVGASCASLTLQEVTSWIHPAQAVPRTNPNRDRRVPPGACTVPGTCSPAALVAVALSLKSSLFGCHSARWLSLHRD